MSSGTTRPEAAQILAPVLTEFLGAELPIRVTCWDGSTAGPVKAPVHLRLNHRALRRLAWAPNELGLARAFVAGDLQVDGDLMTALQHLEDRLDPSRGLQVGGRLPTKPALLSAAARLGALGPPVPPPSQEAPANRRWHSRGSDARAISHHYDVGNDFYRLFLGESMVYSCAYFRDAGDPLDTAQAAKLELIAGKLALAPGMRVLDVGCGWGGFLIHAAREHGVRGVGVTLSREQYELGRKRAAEEGVGDLVEIRLQDYRDVDDGPYDAVASIGMAEHVGRTRLATYCGQLARLVQPGGRVLNHAIATVGDRARRAEHSAFIDRYVFPDGELLPVADTVTALEDAGLEVRDVQALREHYALTLRHWVANLEAAWEDAVRLAGPARARVWQLYMTVSVLAFERGRIGVNQVLAVRPDGAGASDMPLVRSF